MYYLVRTACNLGMSLLEIGLSSDRVERGRFAVSLAAQSFEYGLEDIYSWALMRDGLAASGRVTDAELVGWEAVRRFLENVRWRTQLANMLAVLSGNPDIAEALLRENVALISLRFICTSST